ncbi:MAG: hypothetical protein ACK41T_07555 [Pseudobdellovibrio sp.]
MIKIKKVKTLTGQIIKRENSILDHVVDLNSAIRENCHQVIFQEFLHFAGPDNKSREKHNKATKESRYNRTDDVVYSCARLAFNYGTKGLSDDPSSTDTLYPDVFSRLSFVKSCMTCGLAKITNGGAFIQDNPSNPDLKTKCLEAYENVEIKN